MAGIKTARSQPAFTTNRSFKVERGLYLREPAGGRTYQARARIDGRWRCVGTETADIRAAEQFALKWYRQLHAGREGHETIAQAAAAFLKSVRDADKRAYHATKWEAVREFWSPGFDRPTVTVAEVNTPKLLQFVQWRQERTTGGRSQNPTISASTLHKDLVTLRQILKHAVDRGVIPAVPKFPGVSVLGSIETNPQPWLTKDEWKHLMAVARKRIADAPNKRTRNQRQELSDFCEFMHGTALRVDETYSLQVRDVTIAYQEPTDFVPIDGTVARKLAVVKRKRGEKWTVAFQVPFLKIRVRDSKTGVRECVSRLHTPVQAFTRLSTGKGPTDPLFTARHRDAFRELLIAANLRTNAHSHPRNAKCLRPTAISHWLLDRPTIPLSWLAANCGTSITMLQSFYIKRLGLGLDGSAWL